MLSKIGLLNLKTPKKSLRYCSLISSEKYYDKIRSPFKHYYQYMDCCLVRESMSDNIYYPNNYGENTKEKSYLVAEIEKRAKIIYDHMHQVNKNELLKNNFFISFFHIGEHLSKYWHRHSLVYFYLLFTQYCLSMGFIFFNPLVIMHIVYLLSVTFMTIFPYSVMNSTRFASYQPQLSSFRLGRIRTSAELLSRLNHLESEWVKKAVEYYENRQYIGSMEREISHLADEFEYRKRLAAFEAQYLRRLEFQIAFRKLVQQQNFQHLYDWVNTETMRRIDQKLMDDMFVYGLEKLKTMPKSVLNHKI